MLVFSRKKNESIVINNDVTVTVVEIRDDKVRLGIVAPKEVPVRRAEIFEQFRAQNALWDRLEPKIRAQCEAHRVRGLSWCDQMNVDYYKTARAVSNFLPTDDPEFRKPVLCVDPAVTTAALARAYGFSDAAWENPSCTVVQRPQRPYLVFLDLESDAGYTKDLRSVFFPAPASGAPVQPLTLSEVLLLALDRPQLLEAGPLTAGGTVRLLRGTSLLTAWTPGGPPGEETLLSVMSPFAVERRPEGKLGCIFHRDGCRIPTARVIL